MTHARIISIGTELVLGGTTDTNAGWIAAQLAAVGIRAIEHVTVGDDRTAIRDAVTRAASKSDVVIVTGGLGPTDDDLTRRALADAMGVALEHRPELARRIEAFFADRRRPMPESNLVQARVPAGATPLENRRGTAPGLRARIGQGEVYCLPGVPAEMREMFDQHVRPVLSVGAAGGVIRETVVQTFGGSEAEVGQRLADLMTRSRNPEVGTTARDGVIGVRIVASADSLEAAEPMLARDVAVVRDRLGCWVFGLAEATLEQAVGKLLLASGRTLATAESCTGGLIAQRITDVPGSSRYFLAGFVTYSDAAKMRELGVPAELIASHGAVSAAVARAMARGCRERTGADYALAVTGIAGPQGGTPDKPVGLVFVAAADPDGIEVRQRRWGCGLSRMEVRRRSASDALNVLRLRIEPVQAENTS